MGVADRDIGSVVEGKTDKIETKVTGANAIFKYLGKPLKVYKSSSNIGSKKLAENIVSRVELMVSGNFP